MTKKLNSKPHSPKTLKSEPYASAASAHTPTPETPRPKAEISEPVAMNPNSLKAFMLKARKTPNPEASSLKPHSRKPSTLYSAPGALQNSKNAYQLSPPAPFKPRQEAGNPPMVQCKGVFLA